MHGYLSSGDCFARQISFFARDFNVYSPDLKGFGYNVPMERPYKLDDYVSDLVKFTKENNIVRPNVVAHSFGGRIVLKLAYQNPLFFDKIVLTGCAGLKPRRSLKYHLKRNAYKLLKPIISKDRLQKFFSSDYLALDEVMRESFKYIVNEHLDYTLQSIKNPTLIIFGDKDKETPLYMAKKLNKNIKDSQISILNGAGHFAFVDKPFKFNMEVNEFFNSL